MKLDFLSADSLSAPCPMGWSWFYQTIKISAKGFPSLCLPVGQTPAFNFFKSLNRAFAVSHVAEIVAVVKLCQIQRQMLFADMVKCADDTTLEQAEKSLVSD
jgi:hypothetical protein